MIVGQLLEEGIITTLSEALWPKISHTMPQCLILKETEIVTVQR